MYFKSYMKNIFKWVVITQKCCQFEIDDDVHFYMLQTIFTSKIIEKHKLEELIRNRYSPCFVKLVVSSIQELYDSNMFRCCVISTYEKLC